MTSYSGKIIRKTPVTPTQTSASGVWTTADAAAAVKNNLWPVPGVPDPISRSVRLRSSASAYFNRTFGTPTNNKIYTWSMWVKRGDLTAATVFVLASCPTAGFLSFGDGTNPVIRWNDGTADIITSSFYRDPSAWYHIVVAVDTTQATSSNRVKIYVNGVQLTAFSTAGYPSLNASQNWNSAGAHNIGSRVSTSTLYYDGYLTEVNFVDGQQLTPSSFGTTNAFTGAWIPMPYTGTYGANGFYLNFKDNTSTTTIGYDYSGNANNWVANNISLTAGTTYDSMLDVPTNWVGYSATTDKSAVTRGNYCVVNPLKKGASATITNANLTVAISVVGGEQPANFALSSGKWYWEATPTTAYYAAGIILTSRTPSASSIANDYHYYGSNGQFYTNTSGVAYGATFGNGDVIGVALDLDTNQITFYKNGASQGAKTIVAGEYNPDFAGGTTVTINANFGQRPFSYTPPTGFTTLCTTNLPTPTILNGAGYMAATLYTGNGSAGRVITVPNINEVGFAWVKLRSGADDHRLANTVTGGNKHLKSNSTDAESSGTNVIQAFSSNTFTVGSDNGVNANASTYVAWTWAANGAAVSNTNGTITSQVSANTTAGFSIATYTGTGSNATVGHGLGVAPSMVIVKLRSGAGENWNVWHTSLASTTYRILLNTTGAVDTGSPTIWSSGGISPTSTTFTVGTSSGTNGSASTYVAYCFAAVTGYSAFGKYTGNGAADGPFVYTGFRPRFILLKAVGATSAGNWYIYDTSRETYNQEITPLWPNLANAESANTVYAIDVVSNGFKIRTSASSINPASSETAIYAAFAENPFNYSNAR